MFSKTLKKKKKELIAWIGGNKTEFVILMAILLVASFLRLYRIADYMTFLGDEGRDALTVKRIIVDHKWTLLGPTASVGGFFLGPIYYYFMVPFLWLFRLDPVGPAVMVALFGVATVFLVWKVGKDFFSPQAGLMAALLYSISPLVIAYSRSSWNPNLVPFFSLLYVYSLFKIIKITGWRWWFISGLCIGIGLQLHYLFTFLMPLGIVFLFVYKRRPSYWKFWGLKLLGLITGWSPFIAFEIRHSFPNIRTLYNFIFHGKETGLVGMNFSERLGEIIFRLFSRLVFRFPPPEQYHLFSKNLLFSWELLISLVLVTSLIILIVQIVKKKKLEHLLLICWLAFGVGLFLFYKKAVYDYYLGIMFPLPFLLVGNLISFFWKKKVARLLAVLLFSGLVILNWSGRSFKFPPNRQLAQTKQIAKFILDKAEGKPFNFALITGQNSDHAYRYFLEIWGNSPVTIENPQIDPERKTITDQLFIVCESLPCFPEGHPLWEIAGFGRAEIEEEWNVSVLKVYKLKHWQEENERETI